MDNLKLVEDADFTDPRAEALVIAMRQLDAAGDPIDPVTVLGQMRRTGLDGCMTDDQSVGVYLSEVLASAPNVGSIGHYLTVVIEHRVRRDMHAMGERLQQGAETSDLMDLRLMFRDQLTHLSVQLTRLKARPLVAAS